MEAVAALQDLLLPLNGKSRAQCSEPQAHIKLDFDYFSPRVFSKCTVAVVFTSYFLVYEYYCHVVLQAVAALDLQGRFI